MERTQTYLPICQQIVFPKLQEAPERSQQLQAFRRELARHRVQYDVDSFAMRDLANVIGKGERASVQHVLHP